MPNDETGGTLDREHAGDRSTHSRNVKDSVQGEMGHRHTYLIHSKSRYNSKKRTAAHQKNHTQTIIRPYRHRTVSTRVKTCSIRDRAHPPQSRRETGYVSTRSASTRKALYIMTGRTYTHTLSSCTSIRRWTDRSFRTGVKPVSADAPFIAHPPRVHPLDVRKILGRQEIWRNRSNGRNTRNTPVSYSKGDEGC